MKEKDLERLSGKIASRFHLELEKLRYDLGGSLADLVEDSLAAALKAVADEEADGASRAGRATRLRASDALELTLSAGDAEERERQLQSACDVISQTARAGFRRTPLCSIAREYDGSRRRNKCYEYVVQKLLDEGYRIETRREVVGEVVQDPIDYLVW